MINTARYLCTHHVTQSDIEFVYLIASGDMSQSGMTVQTS
jgi:hypothetical protein